MIAFECRFLTHQDKLSKKVVVVDVDIVLATQAASELRFKNSKLKKYKRLLSIKEIATEEESNLLLPKDIYKN